MKKHPELGYIPVAFVDDDEGKKGQVIHGVPIIGTRDDIEKIVSSKDIDEILIALPSASLEERKNI